MIKSNFLLIICCVFALSCLEKERYYLDFNFTDMTGVGSHSQKQKACISYTLSRSYFKINYYFDRESYSEFFQKGPGGYVKLYSRPGGEISENAMTIRDSISRNIYSKEIYWHDSPDTTSKMYLMERYHYFTDSVVQYDFMRNCLYYYKKKESLDTCCLLYKTVMTYSYRGDTLIQGYNRVFTNLGKEYFKGNKILSDGAFWIEKSKFKYPYRTWFRFFPEAMIERY